MVHLQASLDSYQVVSKCFLVQRRFSEHRVFVFLFEWVCEGVVEELRIDYTSRACTIMYCGAVLNI